MGKFIKPGKVVIVLSGRYAGRKAVVIKTFDDGDKKERKFGHALIAGIDRYPRRITRAMTDKEKGKRLRVKPFVKFINYQHMMPTRYNLDVTESLAKLIPDEGLTEVEKKKAIRKDVKDTLETRYKNIATGKNEKVTQGVQFFFRKLRF